MSSNPAHDEAYSIRLYVSVRGFLRVLRFDPQIKPTPTGSSEAVNRRRKDNAMAKRKKDNITQKTKGQAPRTPLTTGVNLEMVSSSIYNYLCNQCLSPLTLLVRILHMACLREEYSIQHYVIKFVSDLRQIGCFLWVLRFNPPIRLTATILLKYC